MKFKGDLREERLRLEQQEGTQEDRYRVLSPPSMRLTGHSAEQ